MAISVHIIDTLCMRTLLSKVAEVCALLGAFYFNVFMMMLHRFSCIYSYVVPPRVWCWKNKISANTIYSFVLFFVVVVVAVRGSFFRGWEGGRMVSCLFVCLLFFGGGCLFCLFVYLFILFYLFYFFWGGRVVLFCKCRREGCCCWDWYLIIKMYTLMTSVFCGSAVQNVSNTIICIGHNYIDN